jgi:hypothetical protein
LLLGGRTYFLGWLLNVHNISDVRQTEMHTAELLVPEPRPSEIEIAFPKLKKYKP